MKMIVADRLHVCVFAIMLACVSASYGSNEIETSYDNGLKILRDVGKGTNGNPIRNTKRNTVNSTSVGLWFGPRLGKRRKSSDVPEIEPEELDSIAEALYSGPWAFISIPHARRTGIERRQATQFTPRLGREVSEKVAMYEPDQLFNKDQDMQAQLPMDSLQQLSYMSRDEREQLSPLLQMLRKSLF